MAEIDAKVEYDVIACPHCFKRIHEDTIYIDPYDVRLGVPTLLGEDHETVDDFECPFCGKKFTVEIEVLSEYKYTSYVPDETDAPVQIQDN